LLNFRGLAIRVHKDLKNPGDMAFFDNDYVEMNSLMEDWEYDFTDKFIDTLDKWYK
jgi:hypothetical protein